MIWMTKILLFCLLQANAMENNQQNSQQTSQQTVQESSAVEAAVPSAEIAVEIPQETSAKNLKETEIPVRLDAVKKSEVSEAPVVKYFLSFGIIVVLGGAAFFLLRKYQFRNPKSQAAQIKILSQHFLGPKKSLAIVRVAGESILIGVTDHGISMIKSLSLLDEDIPDETPKEFETLFKKEPAPAATRSEETDSKDEFAISGIRDFVSVKLKNMRSLE